MYRQGILKEKKARFRLMCVAQRRRCLNSLLVSVLDQVVKGYGCLRAASLQGTKRELLLKVL